MALAAPAEIICQPTKAKSVGDFQLPGSLGLGKRPEGAEQRVQVGSARTPSVSPSREGSGAGSLRCWQQQDLWAKFGEEMWGWGLCGFCLLACLFVWGFVLFWFDFFFPLGFCLFVCFPCWLSKGYFLAVHGEGRENPWVGISPALGVCAAPLSCWGRGGVLQLFCPPLLHSERWGCRDPPSPSLACLSGDFGATQPWDAHRTQQSSAFPKLRHTRGEQSVSKAQHRWAHTTHTYIPQTHTHHTSCQCWGSTASPPSASVTLPHAEPQPLSTPSHTQPTPRTTCPTFILQLHKTQHRFTHAVQQCTPMFSRRCRREGPETHWKLLMNSYGLCIGKRNEVDFFSFGSGLGPILHPRSCRSAPVSVLIHLGNGGLALGPWDLTSPCMLTQSLKLISCNNLPYFIILFSTIIPCFSQAIFFNSV